MRKLFRKSIVLFLALALIAGSLSAAVFALTENESGIFNLYTKFYRVDSNGDPLENEISEVSYTGADTCDGTLYVKKGDRIKAVMSAESLMADGSDPASEFNVYEIALLLSFNKNMVTLEPDYYSYTTIEKTFSSPVGTISSNYGGYIAAACGINDSTKEYVYATTDSITDIGGEHNDGGFVLTRDGNGKDIITWYFTVNNDASLDATTLFSVEEASVCLNGEDPQVYATTIVSFDDEGEIDSSFYNLTLNSYSETLAFGGTVTYDTNNTALGVTGTIAASSNIIDKGSGVYEEVGRADAAATLPAVTVAAGTTFLGWATEQDAPTPDVTAATLKAESPDTLYAVYSQEASVVFVYGNGMTDYVINANVGDPIDAPADPEWAYNYFLGWSDGRDTYTSADIGALTVPAGGITFTAQWEPAEYTITFVQLPAEFNGGVDGDKIVQTYQYMDWVNPPDDPCLEGHIFLGWDPQPPDSMPAEDLVITALWAPYDYNISYYSDESLSQDALIASYSLPYGEKIGANIPPASVREGYTVTGWIIDDGWYYESYAFSPDEIADMEVPAGDINFVARWSINSYTVTFDCGTGAENTVQVYDYGEAISPPAVPEREGYVFAGWDADIPLTMPAENLTFTAQWNAADYTVTYALGNGEADTVQVYNYGEAIIPPADPVWGGHLFDGWDSEIPAVMPAGNITVNAKWKAIIRSDKYDVSATFAESDFDADISSLRLVAEKVSANDDIPGAFKAEIKKPERTSVALYEIHIADESGSYIQPRAGSSVTVKMLAPEELDLTKDFYIAHLLQSGKIDRIKSGSYSIDGRYILFEVGEFSKFMIVQQEEEISAVISPSVRIAGYRASRAEDYKSTGTFHAVAENMPEGAAIQWFVNGSKAGTGETFTKEKATSTYEIQVKVVAADGTALAESQTEKVEISSGFIARIIAFFRQLLRRLPAFDQK